VDEAAADAVAADAAADGVDRLLVRCTPLIGGTGMNAITRAPLRRLTFVACTLIAIAIVNFGCTATQRSFKSPEDAVESLVAAMRTHDTKKLQEIFGPDSDDVLFSGDPVDDQLIQDQFLRAFDERRRLSFNDEDSVTLLVGNDDWPMPIPIVKNQSGKSWIFDTASGKDEVITRRIGRNELTVIEVCKAICDAQREYAQRDTNRDGIPRYARKFISDPGRTNGLYWPTGDGERPSPLGEAVAQAHGEGYSTSTSPTGQPRPYHGYLYRILTAQGKDAPGGAEDYVINGKLIGGFAVVAWPVDYGSSGVMTFVTNYTGDVYQKDLGDDTDKLARAMTEYNPDSTWKKAE
jgi:hypothetical protein